MSKKLGILLFETVWWPPKQTLCDCETQTHKVFDVRTQYMCFVDNFEDNVCD